MKTKLPSEIKTVNQAIDFINELIKNGEIFNPDDSAHDVWFKGPKGDSIKKFTPSECDKLDDLFDQIFSLSGRFDPIEYIQSTIYVTQINICLN